MSTERINETQDILWENNVRKVAIAAVATLLMLSSDRSTEAFPASEPSNESTVSIFSEEEKDWIERANLIPNTACGAVSVSNASSSYNLKSDSFNDLLKKMTPCVDMYAGTISLVYYEAVDDRYAQRVASQAEQIISNMTESVVALDIDPIPATQETQKSLDKFFNDKDGCLKAGFSASENAYLTMKDSLHNGFVAALPGVESCKQVGGTTDSSAGMSDVYAFPGWDITPESDTAKALAHEIGHALGLGHELGAVECDSQIGAIEKVSSNYIDYVSSLQGCNINTYGAQHGSVMGASYDFSPEGAYLSAVNMDALRRRIEIVKNNYDPAVLVTANTSYDFDVDMANKNMYAVVALDETVETSGKQLSDVNGVPQEGTTGFFSQLIVHPYSSKFSEIPLKPGEAESIFQVVLSLKNDAYYDNLYIGTLISYAHETGKTETQKIKFGDQMIELTFNSDGTLSVAHKGL